MNSDQLLKFIAIADHKTMTEAAESLFITQSALSHTLADLEEELGCKLFVRDKKNLIITASGEKLLSYARNITNLVNQATINLSNDKKLNIAAINVCAAYMLANYPEDRLKNIGLLQIRESEMPAALMKQEADIVACDDMFMRQYKIPGLRKFVLCREQLGLFVPKGHRFYDKKVVTYDDLYDEPLCMRSDFFSQILWMDRIQTVSGTKFRVEFSMDRYTYMAIRDKIPYPEIRQVTSIFDPKIAMDDRYKYVKINDMYSSRFIYMWYLEDNYEKVSPIIESVKKYYMRSRKDGDDNLSKAVEKLYTAPYAFV